MVLWICVGVLVFGLGVLAVLLFDLKGKADRLQRALATAQKDTAPQVSAVRHLADSLANRGNQRTNTE